MNEKEKLRNYISQSKRNIKNSRRLIREQEYSKAGKLLWGSIVNLLKAIGLIFQYQTKTHKDIIKLAQRIYTINNDITIRDGIKTYAQGLHANFYENYMDYELFDEYKVQTLKAYEKLFWILINRKI